MTIIVSVKINDGVVMASDSASTFANGQIYLNAEKIFNVVKGVPVGIMFCGTAGIGPESISTLMKDLRNRLTPTNKHDWAIDPNAYSVLGIAQILKNFLEEKCGSIQDEQHFTQFRICGYSSERPLPEIWEVRIHGKTCFDPVLIHQEDKFGLLWDGEYDALNRLILGGAPQIPQLMTDLEFPALTPEKMRDVVYPKFSAPIVMSAMPIHDAVDLARFAVELTVGFTRFSLNKQPKTVGGPIEIAAITKHEGFRWIHRKHFYPSHLNP